MSPGPREDKIRIQDAGLSHPLARPEAPGGSITPSAVAGINRSVTGNASRTAPGTAAVVWLTTSGCRPPIRHDAQDLLDMGIRHALHDRSYEDVRTKFYEHFLMIAGAANDAGLPH